MHSNRVAHKRSEHPSSNPRAESKEISGQVTLRGISTGSLDCRDDPLICCHGPSTHCCPIFQAPWQLRSPLSQQEQEAMQGTSRYLEILKPGPKAWPQPLTFQILLYGCFLSLRFMNYLLDLSDLLSPFFSRWRGHHGHLSATFMPRSQPTCSQLKLCFSLLLESLCCDSSAHPHEGAGTLLHLSLFFIGLTQY